MQITDDPHDHLLLQIRGAVAEYERTLIAERMRRGRLATLRAAGTPVFVNMTADWCVTCKINEGAALSSARVGEAIMETDAVYLVGDWTRRDDAIARELERHGRSGVPLYLLYPAGGGEPRILPQLLTEGLVIESLQEAAR